MDCEYCHHEPHYTRCPNAPEPKIHGYCAECYEPLRDDYPYWTDNDGNKFCSEECDEKHNGIIEKEWDEDDE